MMERRKGHGDALCVVHLQKKHGYWLVGIGPVTWQAADTEAELYRSARSARRAAVALAERTGLLVARSD